MAKLNIKEIAKRANVSTATISRVFNNKDNVSKKMKSRITKIIETENYSPNFYARGLTAGKSLFIGCIIPNIANTYFSQLLKAIIQTAEKKKYFVISYDYAADAKKERELVESFFNRGISQIIVSSVNIEENFDFYNEHIKCGKKVILLNKNYTAKDEEHKFPYVSIDIKDGLEKTVNYLNDLNVSKIAYIQADLSYGEPLYRLQTLKNLIKNTNIFLSDDMIFNAQTNLDLAKEELTLKLKPIISKIDAIITQGDITAISILSTFRETIKKNNTKIVSLTKDKMQDILNIHIPAVSHPIEILASTAVEALITWSEKNKKPVCSEFEPKFIP